MHKIMKESEIKISIVSNDSGNDIKITASDNLNLQEIMGILKSTVPSIEEQIIKKLKTIFNSRPTKKEIANFLTTSSFKHLQL